MAKPGGGDVASSRTPMELKEELKRLVKAIVLEEDDDDESSMEEEEETYEEAHRALMALKDVKFGSNGSRNQVPEHFLCPISAQIMKDPVLLSSGQTYDRPYVEQWLNSGNRTCPKTQQVLTNPTTLTPNHLARAIISRWCGERGILLPSLDPNTTTDGTLVTASERTKLHSLLEKLSSSSLIETKQAAKELRLLTRRHSSFRSLIGRTPEAVPRLLAVLSSASSVADLQEDALTAILNLSIEDVNKKFVGENSEAVLLIIDALTSGINMQTRGNAAAALFTLSAIDSNKIRIVELGAMKPLVDLLGNGSLSAKKDAGSAIFNLCTVRENRAAAVSEGVTGVSLQLMKCGSLLSESLALLALLSSYEEVAEELAENDGVACLLKIAREGTSSARDKENATVVLYAVCVDHRRKLKEVKEEERVYSTLSDLEYAGTPRARRKAAGLLERLRKLGLNTHYSC